MTDDLLPVLVDHVEHHGSVAVASGVMEDTGEPVTFAGEARILATIAQAIEDTGEPALAYVSEWQLI